MNCVIVNIEYYVHDISGKEVVIYSRPQNTDFYLAFWNVWGLSNEGKISGDNQRVYYYLKDHLGSIRAVYDNYMNVVSAQDYDAWGYELTNRTFSNNNDSKYKFTSKERDVESGYDYFGARYYDSRIGRWSQMEPLFDKFITNSPYCYSLLEPIKMKDENGSGPRISIVGRSISINFDYYFTTDAYDPDYGLDVQQIGILRKLSANVEDYWSGTFNIGGKYYLIDVKVNLIQRDMTYNKLYTSVNNLSGYNLARNEPYNLNDLEQNSDNAKKMLSNRGLGMSEDVLLLLREPACVPYESSGAHEAGHAMGLPEDYTEPKDGLPPIMHCIFIGKNNEEIRSRPTGKEYEKIFKRLKVENII